MTETWPQFQVRVLQDARIQDNHGNVVWTAPGHVAVVRVRTKLEAILPVPAKLVDDHSALRRYVIDELHHRIDADPKDAMTYAEHVPPAPEPADEPADQHIGPLDNDEDARFLDPVDPRRREVERRRGQPFTEEETP